MECNYCQKKIETGRTDKKFCDAKCRTAYHNRNKKKEESMLIELNKRLYQNWKILKHLSPEGKTTVRKEILETMGYNFDHFSHFYQTQSGRSYFFCYEYGFSPIMENGVEKAILVKYQTYMEQYHFDPWKKIK